MMHPVLQATISNFLGTLEHGDRLACPATSQARLLHLMKLTAVRLTVVLPAFLSWYYRSLERAKRLLKSSELPKKDAESLFANRQYNILSITAVLMTTAMTCNTDNVILLTEHEIASNKDLTWEMDALLQFHNILTMHLSSMTTLNENLMDLLCKLTSNMQSVSPEFTLNRVFRAKLAKPLVPAAWFVLMESLRDVSLTFSSEDHIALAVSWPGC